MAPISGQPDHEAGPARKARRRRRPWVPPGFFSDGFFSDALSNAFRRDRTQPLTRPRRTEAGRAFELDCLRGVLPSVRLAQAAQRAATLGIGAEQVLIREGAIGEADYIARLAHHCGLPIADLTSLQRTDCLLDDAKLHYAARHHLLPLREADGLAFVQAPLSIAARKIAEACARGAPPRVHLTTRAAFNRHMMRHEALAREAAMGLALRSPEMSSAPRPRTRRGRAWGYGLKLLALTSAFMLAPSLLTQLCGAVLAIWFLLFNSLRLAGAFAGGERAPRSARVPDARLPLYTVMVALYHEGASAAHLVQSLMALDYPREKLDILLLLEADDLETQAALAHLDLPGHIQTLIVPPFGPRTKPKALNAGLMFARGDYVAVFDAEDRPEPAQLRDALDAFHRHHDDVACVQASLCVDNSADGWLACMFTAEYAGQFDVFLRGFSRFGLPLPLGGSSNHFRTRVLREVGGWDAYNVTEDADLGFRLARFGYRAVMFDSTTHEEAPARTRAWLRQRSRWMKGWMQTWIVHMRSPHRLIRQSGPSGFFTLNLLVGGNVLTALAYPVLIAACLLEAGLTATGHTAVAMFSGPFIELHVTTIAAGYLSTVVVSLMGLARRGLLRHAWVLVLTPFYWAWLSIAAWRALWQLLHDPYRWEKTEHGLARHSRLALNRRGKTPPAMARRTAGLQAAQVRRYR